MKFFIVDDDPDIIEVMTVLLEDAGHSVSSNTTGIDAVAQIAAKRPDCVLTDLMMAGMDGLELCRELRARTDLGDLTIVVVSVRSHDTWKNRAAEAGADGYITKPLDPDAFAGMVKGIVEGR